MRIFTLVLCWIMLTGSFLAAGNSDKKQKKNAKISQEKTQDHSKSPAESSDGVSFVNSAGKEVLKVLENGIVKADTIIADEIVALKVLSAAMLYGDGSNLTNLPSSGWGLTGNSGTDTSLNFIGTTDDMPLDFRINNIRALRLSYGFGEFDTIPNIIGGYQGNALSDSDVIGATISGGGEPNDPNIITKRFATISGGRGNQADGISASIGGGSNNLVSGARATIGGGSSNTANGLLATIGGGSSNKAEDFGATVPGGTNNRAAGRQSFAAGNLAKANHAGTFVWNGNTSLTPADSFFSTADHQFLVNASGGVGINKNNPVTALDVAGTVTATAFIGDGSGLTNIPSLNGWGLAGNAGTDTSTNFIGTIDNMPLDIRINNVRGLRLEYAEYLTHGPAPNVIAGFSGNQVSPGIAGATISGGGLSSQVNSVTGDFGVISGGVLNIAGEFATIGGGFNNNASGSSTTIGGGGR